MRGLSLTFAAGSFGALANSLALWAAGVYGITAELNVAIAPDLTLQWLYPRIVWGGLWGFLFLLPLWSGRWLRRGLFFSLGPTAVQLFVVFPQKTPHGLLGLGLGDWTPLVVFVANAVWGLAAAALLKAEGSG
ncbi:MAG: hypothetical protein H6905_05415 [Hyphomicrobiales bacterium]|nr:hypothetical protein [Hyphomicrobiales bacterium]